MAIIDGIFFYFNILIHTYECIHKILKIGYTFLKLIILFFIYIYIYINWKNRWKNTVGKIKFVWYIFQSAWLIVYVRTHRLTGFHYLQYILLSCLQDRPGTIDTNVIWAKYVRLSSAQVSQTVDHLQCKSKVLDCSLGLGIFSSSWNNWIPIIYQYIFL